MHFDGAGYSDAGRVRTINQDSFLVKIAQTAIGEIALAAVADGMGGHERGEFASSTAAYALANWFDCDLPIELAASRPDDVGLDQKIETQLVRLANNLNAQLVNYGRQENVSSGTTLTAFLAIGSRYWIVHVGDSRAYEIAEGGIVQLTDDQTYVKREVDAGRLTPEEALVHPRRNVLLQCLGVTDDVWPVVVRGYLKPQASYLLCSDGFRHVLTSDELQQGLRPSVVDAYGRRSGCASRPDAIAGVLHEMTELAKDRKEDDNITAVLLCCLPDGFQ